MTSRIACLLRGGEGKLTLAAALVLSAFALPTVAHAQSLLSSISANVYTLLEPTFVNGSGGSASTTNTLPVSLFTEKRYGDFAGPIYAAGTASASAQTNYGSHSISWLAFASASYFENATASASSISEWSDALTFDKPGSTGEAGFVSYTVSISGGTATSSYGLTQNSASGFATGSFFGGSYTSQLLAVVLGTPVDVSSRFSGSVSASAPNGFSGTTGGGSVSLTTITLYNSLGQPISGGTMRGASNSTSYVLANGTNLAVVIPEAGTLALLLPALGIVGAVAIRRRKAA